MQEILPFLEDSQVRVLSGNGRFQTSYDVLRQYLRKSLHERVLVCGINDPSALGALQAFRDAGRENHCAIVGHNGSSDAISEMRHSATRLIGSVGCFPERYGEQLIALALQLIDHKAVSPAVLVKHHLITPHNLSDYYPLVKTRTRQRKAAAAPSPLPPA
jgi:ribose transport system substrate-binding protein